MGKKYNDERNANQIYKKTGRNAFLEVLGPSPEFQKVTICITKFNAAAESGSRIEKTYRFYLSFPEILSLARYVNNGSIAKRNNGIKDLIKQGNEQALKMDVWSKQGGSPASENKPAEYRQISIVPATQSRYADLMFKISSGPAKQTKEGLLVPNGKVDSLAVGLTYDELYGMFEYIKVRVQAFCTWMQISGNYTYNGRTMDPPGTPLDAEPVDRTDYGYDNGGDYLLFHAS